MNMEALRFLFLAGLFTATLFGIAFLLTGCAEIEGAGFSNNGRRTKPVVCREIRLGYTQCRSVTK